MEKEDPDKIVLTVRLNREDHATLTALARKEQRSTSQQVRMWISETRKKRGPRKPPPGRSLID